VKVAHVITRLIVGGAQENTLTTVLGLRRQPGVEVQLLAGPTTGPEGSLASPANLAPGLLRTVPHLVRPVHPWADALAYFELKRHFLRHRPDLVHTHSGKAGVLGRLAAHAAAVPLIVHTIHGPSFGPFQGPLANGIFSAAERLAGRRTRHFITVSDSLKAQYLAAGIGQPDQYTRIYSGFELAPFLSARNDPALRQRHGLGPADFVIGKIARLFPLKGHEDLFRAAPEIVRQCPRARFLLVGDGIWRARFEQSAAALGLSRYFVFTGLVPPAEVPGLLGIMDAVAHLSRREGLPRALPQALAAGKPVIAYDCDGAREVCLNDRTGLLLPAGADITPAVLALANHPELRQRLGDHGREMVRQEFAADLMVQRIWQLYQQLTKEENHNPK
jgi:glycosyltransferase involved in cell wall biosynthesis